MNEPNTNPRPKPRHFSMLRSLVFADFLTLGNAASGTTAIMMCLKYSQTGENRFLWVAFALLPIAAVLDFFDGFVARWRRRQSALGGDLDSLSDVISFGVAPAVLGYTLGLDGFLDMAALIYFVTCGIARLARYNVTCADLADDSGKVKYYEGTPIPTSLLLVVMWAVAVPLGAIDSNVWLGEVHLWQGSGGAWHPISLAYALSGSLMVSATFRVPKI